MKNKSTLVMIEQIVMLLVFVLAATVCIRMFVGSEQLSRKYEATDRAVRVAQNAAELLKKDGPAKFTEKMKAVQSDGNTGEIYYDKDWKVTEAGSAAFVAEVTYTEEESDFLFRAEIVISTVDGTELFRLPVAWQANNGGGDRI